MKSVTWRRIGIFIAALVPMAWLVYRAATLQLGADPAKYIVLFTGDWAMYFLLATLAVTPLVRLCRWRGLMAHRRMLGLFSLFYALSHVAAYCVFILGLDFGRFFSELVKRPYISAGAPAVLILLALGLTSTRGMMRRLGKGWKKLHRLVYLALLLAWVHLLWQVRSSYFEAALIGAIALVLLGLRIDWYKRRH